MQSAQEQTITAVFRSDEAARNACASLAAAAVQVSAVTPSRSTTEDPLAAEYPGQSFENQPGQGASRVFGSPRADAGPDPAVSLSARRNTLARSGTCMVSVLVASAQQRERVVEILRDHGGAIAP